MVLIPAGTFDMGSGDGAGRPDERPIHKVYVKAFHLSRHEITAQEYCDFLNRQGEAGPRDIKEQVQLSDPACQVIKDGKRFRPKDGQAEKPMVYVSWYGAADYAESKGARLPTSAEWEKAALYATEQPPGDYLTILPRTDSVPISIAEPGLSGVTGIIGNVWEWCSDWYGRDYYSKSPLSNPQGPELGLEKVIRGGSWASPESSRRIQNVFKAAPQGFYRTVGFRIVKD